MYINCTRVLLYINSVVEDHGLAVVFRELFPLVFVSGGVAGSSEKAVLVNYACFHICIHELLGGELHQLVHGIASRCGQEVLRDVYTMLHRVSVGDISTLTNVIQGILAVSNSM